MGWLPYDAKISLDHGGIEHSFDRDSGPRAVVTYTIDYTDAYRFAKAMVGGWEKSAGCGPPIYTPPHAYPPEPRLTARRILSITGLGIKAALSTPTDFDIYHRAIVKVEYGTAPFATDIDETDQQLDPDDPITYCTQRIRMSANMVLIEADLLEFDDGDPLTKESGVIEVQAEITLTFPRITCLPWERVSSYLGKVNSSTLWGKAPESILFVGAETEATSTSAGLSAQQLVLSFLWNERGWNTALKPDGTYGKIRFKADTDKHPYDLAELRYIFR